MPADGAKQVGMEVTEIAADCAEASRISPQLTVVPGKFGFFSGRCRAHGVDARIQKYPRERSALGSAPWNSIDARVPEKEEPCETASVRY